MCNNDGTWFFFAVIFSILSSFFTAIFYSQRVTPSLFSQATAICESHGGLRYLSMEFDRPEEAVCEDNAHYFTASLEKK